MATAEQQVHPPRRIHFVVAALAFSLFALYGSLVPLNYTPVDLQTAINRFESIPYFDIELERRSDWVANILLFVPIGFFWMGACAVDLRKRLWPLGWALVVVVGSAAGSVLLEFLQTWFPPRTVSQNDIAAETLGGIAGVALWFLCGQTLTDWVRHVSRTNSRKKLVDWLLQAYGLGLFLYSVMPLDLTLSPAQLHQKYHEGKIVLVPFRNFSWKAEYLWGCVEDVALFIPIGALIARTAARRDSRIARNIPASLAVGFVLVAGIETCQLFVLQRHSDATDVVTGMLGVLAGICLARRFKDATPTENGASSDDLRRGLAWHVAAMAYGLFLCGLFWWPLELKRDSHVMREHLDGFFRAPFAAMYQQSEYDALTNLTHKLLLFAVEGALLGMCVVGYPLPVAVRRIFLVACVGLCFLLGTAIELGQSIFPPHVPDITDVVLYTLGASLGVFLVSKWASSKDAPESGQ